MDNTANKEIIAADVAEDRPSLLEKLRQAKFEYSEEGKNPNPEMHDHVEDLITKIEHVRKAQKRADAIKRQKRKAQKQARKRNRR